MSCQQHIGGTVLQMAPSSICLLNLGNIFRLQPLPPGTHFRYGTISWSPRTCFTDRSPTGRDTGSPSGETNCVPYSLDNDNGGIYVEFLVKLAFRRDYDWGRYFGEQWSAETDGSGRPTNYQSNIPNSDQFQNFDGFVAGGTQVVDYQQLFSQGQYHIKFPAGYGSTPPKPIPTSATPGHEVSGSLVGGRLCDNPYDDGLLPQCPGTVSVAIDTDRDPRTGNFIPYFPYYMKELDTTLGATCNCTLDEIRANFGTCPTTCKMDCETSIQPSAFQGGSTVCGPWAYSYGFYTGIETLTGNVDYHRELEIQLKEINVQTGSSIGNFITGEGTLQVQYPTALAPSNIFPQGEPWLAFFTGGDRIGRDADLLQNNYGGRYRLEVSVNLMCHFAGDCWQRSAVATSLPVVPIPYTERNGYSLYDFSFSTFRIAAYDPRYW